MPVKQIYCFINPPYFYFIANIGEDAFKEARLGNSLLFSSTSNC